MPHTYETIEVHPLSTHVGAEIRGVDLGGDLSDRTIAEIKHAFHEAGMVVFHDQNLTPEQHIAFARHIGDINVNRFFASLEGYPEIAEVLKEPHHEKNIGGGWHTDHTYDQAPALGSALLAREVPPTGGDTLFAHMAAVFDSLSDGLKDMLRTMKARHSSRHVFGASRYVTEEQQKEWEGRMKNADAALQDAVHPVVITHPESGREVLYVNGGFTLGFEGWTDEESKPLLDYLYSVAVRPEFTCRLAWRKGSLALWDNRATWHYALNDYPGERRYMHRITIEGSELH